MEPSRRNVKAAKEIMINLKLLIPASVIAVISVFVFYQHYEINKYDDFYETVSPNERMGDRSFIPLDGRDFPHIGSFRIGENVRAVIDRRKEYFKSKAHSNAMLVFFASAGILIIGRYLINGLKWAHETSQHDL